MVNAKFYKQLHNKHVQCFLCPHYCVIKSGSRGKCGVRENVEGILYTLVYGKVISSMVDPIEKKPLFHFLPGSSSLSIATMGCNMSCEFCQNWEISQSVKPQYQVIGQEMSSEDIINKAMKNNCESISYTYTEPTIFYEFAYDTAKIAREHGLKNVFVTNGYINPEPQDEVCSVLDAVNVDLKGFSDEYYMEVCGAKLQPVLEAIRKYYENGVWIEITTLIVPGHNDSDEMLLKMGEFIASIDLKIPWHISRFYPTYKVQHLPITDIDTIHKAVEIGKKLSLKYVYTGNIPGDNFENTYCPHCKRKVITREGFTLINMNLNENICKNCNEKIDLIL
ncbi:MAG TPA: AmmeMemoRadiSam system radical SAM enzyme [Anaerolineae bacterium]|nr:AmmeMemoRadiSam system radical SAM enzyme [Anaerolineae bacterium]